MTYLEERSLKAFIHRNTFYSLKKVPSYKNTVEESV